MALFCLMFNPAFAAEDVFQCRGNSNQECEKSEGLKSKAGDFTELETALPLSHLLKRTFQKNLSESIESAWLTKSCLESGSPYGSTNKSESFVCAGRLRQVANELEVLYPAYRKSLALTKSSKIKDGVVESSPSRFKLSKKLSGPAAIGAKKQDLTEDEQAMAELSWDMSYFEFASKYREVMLKSKSNAQLSPDEMETVSTDLTTHLNRLKRNIQENAKIEAAQILSAAPYLSYLSSPRPSKKDVINAVAKTKENAEKFTRVVNTWGLQKSENLIMNGPLVKSVIKKHPYFCERANSLYEKVKKREKMKNKVTLALGVGALAACVLSGPFAPACMMATGSALGLSGVYSTYKDYEESRDLLLSGHDTEKLTSGEIFDAYKVIKNKESLYGGTMLLASSITGLPSAGRALGLFQPSKRSITNILKREGIHLEPQLLNGKKVLAIKGSSDSVWVSKISKTLKEKYGTEVVIINHARSSLGYQTVGANNQIYIAVRHNQVVDGVAENTILHEIVHAKNVARTRQGMITPLAGQIRSQSIPKAASGYKKYMSMDEVEAFYKGANAAKRMSEQALKNKQFSRAAILRAEYMSQLSSAKVNAKSVKFVGESAIKAIKEGKAQMGNYKDGFFLKFEYKPAFGGTRTIRLDYPLPKGVRAENSKYVISRVQESIKKVEHYQKLMSR